jgi:hypothetical protein
MRKRPITERFWEKVNKDGPEVNPKLGKCWVWTGAHNKQGYGWILVAKKVGRHAHRVSWFLSFGEFPALDVLHRCDNPPCVRIDHLFLGNDDVNAKDRKAKGRDGNHKGSANGRAKLDEAKAREIRARYAAGEPPGPMAAHYGVSLAAVWFVISGRTWKHA